MMMSSLACRESGLAQLDQVLEIHALDELHRDEEVAVHLAEVVDADHVRVLERSRRLRLAQEALAEIVLPRDRLVHHLHATVRSSTESGPCRPHPSRPRRRAR